MGIILNDTFTGSAGDLSLHVADSGAVWTPNSNYSGVFLLSGSGTLVRPLFPATGNSGEIVYYSDVSVPGGDLAFEVGLTFANATDACAFGLYFDADVSNGIPFFGWGSQFFFNGSDWLDIQDPASGHSGVSPFPPTAGHAYVMRLEIVGSSATLAIDGVTQVSRTLGGRPSGKIGIYSYEVGTQNILADYVKVETLAPTVFWTDFIGSEEL